MTERPSELVKEALGAARQTNIWGIGLVRT
jgi:hypothetical protein